MTLAECILYCADNQELIDQFNRLTGSKLGKDDRPAIVRAVDEAAGYNPSENDYLKFMEFVYWVIWLPLQQEAGE